MSLCQNIDNITDKVEDVMLRVYMNNVQEIEPGALRMTDVVIRCCQAVRELLWNSKISNVQKILRL